VIPTKNRLIATDQLLKPPISVSKLYLCKCFESIPYNYYYQR